MVITLGGEALGVFGLWGAGVGVGVWIDAKTLELGPYVYFLAGAGLGAYAGGVLELGAYHDREAFRGRAMEVGAASGKLASLGANASVDRRNLVSGVAADVGLGGGLGAWLLGSVTWIGASWRRTNLRGATPSQ
jgi:hypothetical protein